jgi:transposase
LRRHQVSEYFANRQPCLIAMEACGSAHYWGVSSSLWAMKSD